MADEKRGSGDLLGIAPYGEALNTATKGAVDGAGAFLGRICLPAAEEFGLLWKDKISAWRISNAVKIAQKAEKLLADRGASNLYAHPRLVMGAIENGSWADDDEVQTMWAGLLASSCTDDGRDESNLMFMNLLNQLSNSQVRMLNHSCETSDKFVGPSALVAARNQVCELSRLQKITGVDDVERLDREMDHLRTLGLFHIDQGGFQISDKYLRADLYPTPLALQLYVRAHGECDSVLEYFGLETPAE